MNRIIIFLLSLLSFSCGKVNENIKLNINEDFFGPIKIIINAGHVVELPEGASVIINDGCEIINQRTFVCHVSGVYNGNVVFYGSINRQLKVIVLP